MCRTTLRASNVGLKKPTMISTATQTNGMLVVAGADIMQQLKATRTATVRSLGHTPRNKESGVIFYHCVDSISYVHHPLNSKESVEDAEKWLRRQMAVGKVKANSAYLTRWNEVKEVVEFVIGSNESSFPNVDLNSFDDDPPAQAKPAKPTIPVWIHSQKFQHYVNGSFKPEHRQAMFDMLKRKIETNDQGWFIIVAGHENSYVMVTEPKESSEWTRYEV